MYAVCIWYLGVICLYFVIKIKSMTTRLPKSAACNFYCDEFELLIWTTKTGRIIYRLSCRAQFASTNLSQNKKRTQHKWIECGNYLYVGLFYTRMKKEPIRQSAYSITFYVYYCQSHYYFFFFNIVNEEKKKNNVLVRRGRGSCTSFWVQWNWIKFWILSW